MKDTSDEYARGKFRKKFGKEVIKEYDLLWFPLAKTFYTFI